MSFSQIGTLTPPSSSPARPQPQHQKLVSATPRTLRRPTARKASGIAIGKIITASTPNLKSPHADSPKGTPPVQQRKGSQAALTPNSLAAIPDASESYALTTLNRSPSRSSKMAPSPLTPRAGTSFRTDISVGDTVDVPGDMLGTVRFVGTIPGKKGTFAGVELSPDFATRGKNDGDVDGFVTPPPTPTPFGSCGLASAVC